MTWWEAGPLVLLAGAIFIVPGLVFSFAVRVHGLSRLLLAPVFTVAMTSVLIMVLPIFHVRWTPVSFAVGCLAISAVAFAIKAVISRKWPDPNRPSQRRPVLIASAAGLLGAAALISLQMATALQAPENISQTYDNVFHLNAVRWAMDSGDASPLSLGGFTGISAYPSAWHAMTSLLAMSTGVGIPVAVNVTNLAIGAIVWPFGCLYLVHGVVGYRVIATVVAMVFAPAFTGFPLMVIDWGVLYPNLLSIALLPAALGLAINALGLGYHSRPSSPTAWLLLLVSVAAVAVAHPSTTMALLVFTLPLVLAIIYHKVKKLLPMDTPERRRGVLIIVGLSLAASIVLAIVWRHFRPPTGSASWGAVETASQAVGEILVGGALGRPAAVVIAVCTVAGLTRLWITRSRRWLIGTYAVASVLFFYAAGLDFSPRWFLTGVWYYDSYRLAALLPVAIIGPAVVGATFLWDEAVRKFAAIRSRWNGGRQPSGAKRPHRTAAVYSVGVAVLVLLTQFGVMTWAVNQAHWTYKATATSGLLSPDEMTLLQRLDSHVEPGAAIAGLPSSGTALAYAFSGRTVIQPHILTTHGDDVDIVNAGLKDAGEFPWVCDAVRALNVRYVLDFGTRTVTGTLPGYGGVMDLADSPSLKLEDQQGTDAKLFKVTACW